MICALERPGNNDHPCSKTVVTKYYFSLKETKVLVEMDDSRAGTENVQDERAAVCHSRKKSSQGLLELCLKDLGANLNRLLLDKDGTI